MKDCAHVPELGGQQLPTAAKTKPTIDELREYLDYDPETGVLRWRKNPHRHVIVGRVAGNVGNHGYLQVQLRGTKFLAHRVAFALRYGRWPTPYCDHINGVQTDNRIVNLRECSASGNAQNAVTRRDNTTGVKGVYAHLGAYVAQVGLGGTRYNKRFCRLEDAAAWVKQTREQLHGEFARH